MPLMHKHLAFCEIQKYEAPVKHLLFPKLSGLPPLLSEMESQFLVGGLFEKMEHCVCIFIMETH